MTRSVKHIVNCHTIATSRSKAGLPVWDKKIDIRSIIQADQENESPEHIMAVSKKISALLRAKIPKKYLDFMDSEFYDSELDLAIENLESCTLESMAKDAKNGEDPVDIFNEWLNTIYDWADINRVWLGN